MSLVVSGGYAVIYINSPFLYRTFAPAKGQKKKLENIRLLFFEIINCLPYLCTPF